MEIYILEDNLVQQGRLEQALDKELKPYGKTLACVQTFDQPDQLLEALGPANSQQLFFLDIEIKGKEKEGLHLAQDIRKQLPDAHIVFVTTHSEFMPLTFSYQLLALDYIDKALDENAFQQKIATALAYVAKYAPNQREETFSFHSETDHIELPYDRLLYIETSSKGHNVILQGTHNRYEFRANISTLAKANPKLFRSHRSYLINPNKIIRLDKKSKTVEMLDGSWCSVSRTRIGELLKLLNKEKGK